MNFSLVEIPWLKLRYSVKSFNSKHDVKKNNNNQLFISRILQTNSALTIKQKEKIKTWFWLKAEIDCVFVNGNHKNKNSPCEKKDVLKDKRSQGVFHVLDVSYLWHLWKKKLETLKNYWNLIE